jgi:hypothetical protein
MAAMLAGVEATYASGDGHTAESVSTGLFARFLKR